MSTAQEAAGVVEAPVQTVGAGLQDPPSTAPACPVCGAPVVQKVRRGLPKVYCHERCRRVAWHRSHPRIHVAPKPAPAARPKRPRPMPRAKRVAHLVRFLADFPIGCPNVLVIRTGCPAYSSVTSRAVKADLELLEEQGLVELQPFGDVLVRIVLRR